MIKSWITHVEVFLIYASTLYWLIHAIKWEKHNLTHRRFFSDNDDKPTSKQINSPGVGVAIAIALCPVGVIPLGVNSGVAAACGVTGVDGVMELIIVPGVIVPGVLAAWFEGVSSHLERLLLADGVGVSWIKSPPTRSVRGVSAQPLWAGVSRKFKICHEYQFKKQNRLYKASKFNLVLFSESHPIDFDALMLYLLIATASLVPVSHELE